MSIQDIEEQFKQSEQARIDVENLRRKRVEAIRLEVAGFKDSYGAIQLGVAEFKNVFGDLLEAKAFQRLSKVLELVEAASNVEQFGSEIGSLSGALTRIQDTVRDMNQRQTMLVKRLDAEIVKAAKQREAEKDTLQKLNRYLEEWL